MEFQHTKQSMVRHQHNRISFSTLRYWFISLLLIHKIPRFEAMCEPGKDDYMLFYQNFIPSEKMKSNI